MRTDIEQAIERVNYRRRVRRIDETDVLEVLAEARRDDYGWMRGGVVANAYKYPAYTAAAAAIRLSEETFAVRVGSCDAHKGSSPVTWFGPQSRRDKDIRSWLEAVRKDHNRLKNDEWLFLSRTEVLTMIRTHQGRVRADARAKLTQLLETIPDVIITVDDSIKAGNCPKETERVAKIFDYQATNARVVATRFPELASFVRKAALQAETRA